MLIVVMGGMLVPVAVGQAESADGDASSASSKSSKHVTQKVRRPTDYGKYRKDFVELCERLDRDGRKMLIFNLLVPISEKDPKCIDCRPLLNQLVMSCRPKISEEGLKAIALEKQQKARASSSSSEEGASEADEGHAIDDSGAEIPTSVPTPKPARLPSIEVIDVLSEVARRMAEDTARVGQTIQAIEKFNMALLSKENRNLAEREYLETFAAYLNYPFHDAREAIAAELRAEAAESEEDAAHASSAATTEGLFDH